MLNEMLNENFKCLFYLHGIPQESCGYSLQLPGCCFSGDKIVTLYEELQSSEMPPHLLLQVTML
jgi:hypothetical protein